MNAAARDGRLSEEEITRTLMTLSDILQFVDVEKRTELSSAIIDLRDSIHSPDSAAYGDALNRVDAACTVAGAIFVPVRWTGG